MPPAITYREDGAWGTGKGSNLIPSEVDTNFYELVQAIAAIAALEPIQIANIQVVGNQMTVVMEDASEFGPFTLPTAAFNFTGDWQDGFAYEIYDVLTANDGLYLVLQAHETATGSTFNPSAGNMIGPYYQLMIPFPKLYDVAFYAPGVPGYAIEAGDPLFAVQSNKDFFLLTDLAGSVGGLRAQATNELVFPIYKNDTQIGTFTIGGASEIPTEPLPENGTFQFAADVQFSSGDWLLVYPDGSSELDSTARGLSINFAATRGLI